jgi:hypothetical protein
MAHWLRLWLLPKGAPMAQWRTFSRNIPSRFVRLNDSPTKYLPQAEARRRAPLVVHGLSLAGIAKRPM